MATRQGKQETMTDQQVTGALVLAAMFVIFLGVWFFGHSDDRKNSLPAGFGINPGQSYVDIVRN
jgi:hypothetical protein